MCTIHREVTGFYILSDSIALSAFPESATEHVVRELLRLLSYDIQDAGKKMKKRAADSGMNLHDFISHLGETKDLSHDREVETELERTAGRNHRIVKGRLSCRKTPMTFHVFLERSIEERSRIEAGRLGCAVAHARESLELREKLDEERFRLLYGKGFLMPDQEMHHLTVNITGKDPRVAAEEVILGHDGWRKKCKKKGFKIVKDPRVKLVGNGKN